jgi:signal transduction histidine kinase
MNSQINKLTKLIDDLLNISRIQLGKLEFNFHKFDINELVYEMTETLRASTKRHVISISGSISKDVFGDKDRVSQVLSNLINNAIKYSPNSNKVNIHLEENKKGALITVEDFGIGIDDVHLQAIFSRFYRVNDQNEKTFPGLGIGLYISAQIVERHGGEILVSSIKGKGSKFTFTIPFKK